MENCNYFENDYLHENNPTKRKWIRKTTLFLVLSRIKCSHSLFTSEWILRNNLCWSKKCRACFGILNTLVYTLYTCNSHRLECHLHHNQENNFNLHVTEIFREICTESNPSLEWMYYTHGYDHLEQNENIWSNIK